MTWLVIAAVLSLFSGLASVPYLVLFKPWRVKRLAYWLYGRSSIYRRWHIRWFFVRPARKITAAMGALVSPSKRAAAAIGKFGESLRELGLVDSSQHVPGDPA